MHTTFESNWNHELSLFFVMQIQPIMNYRKANLHNKQKADHGSSLIQIKNNQNHTLAKNPIKIQLLSTFPDHAHLKRDEHIAKILH